LRSARLVDSVIAEPLGGAHRDPAVTLASVSDAVALALDGLAGQDGPTLIARRREKFLAMGREITG
jgi:acetyl-CoA carboxylase carboxyl transferase subunit alpha